MAKLSEIAILLVFLSISSTTVLVSFCQGSLVIDEGKPAPKLPEPKQTHLRFYWHENFTGSDPSAIIIAGANSSTEGLPFGVTLAYDNPLTVDPNTTVDVVGKAQGIYTLSSREDFVITITMNLVFMDEKYNQSSLVLSGRIILNNKGKEIPVVGGSGLFRFATGYCLTESYYSDPATNNNIVLFNVYVRHY